MVHNSITEVCPAYVPLVTLSQQLNKQNLYRMQYTIKKVDDKHSEVIEKITICQPDIYECRGSLIAVMTRLLSDNVEPRYYYMQNELVTERLI